LGLNKEANALRTNAENNKKALEVARINADAHLKAAGMSANRATDLDKTTTAEFNALVQKGADPKDPATMQKARAQAIALTGGTGAKLGVNMEAKIGAEHKNIDAAYATRLLMAETDAERKQLEADKQKEKNAVTKRYNEAAKLVSDESPAGGSGGNNPVVVDGYEFPDQASADKYLDAKKKKK